MTLLTQEQTKYRRIAQYIAIVFGINLIFGETLRNWGDWPNWQSYAFDYLFAALLLILGIGVRYTRYVALALMIPVWMLTILLFSWSFIDHIKHIDEPTYGLISQVPLTTIIGVLDLVAICGLIYSIAAIAKTKQQGSQVVT